MSSTLTLPTTHSTHENPPVTTIFSANPKQEYFASYQLRYALRTDSQSAMTALRISLQASQTPNWYSALDADIQEYVRCELGVGCAVSRNYSTPFLPNPTPNPVTTGLWSKSTGGIAFEPFGPLSGIDLAIPWVVLLGTLVASGFFIAWSTCLMACLRECLSRRNSQRLSAINHTSPAQLALTWAFIGGSGGILQCLGAPGFSTSTTFFAGILVSSFGIATIASACNNVFLDTCWKHVMAQSLQRKDGTCHGDNLRAASLDWIDIIHRTFTLRVSGRELQVALSHTILRWSFVISIAIIQRSIVVEGPFFKTSQILSWHDDFTPVWKTGDVDVELSTTRRPAWIAIAVLAHACGVFLGLAISKITPWSLFRDIDADSNLLEAYKPFLEIIVGGSISSSSQVADYLDYKMSVNLYGTLPLLRAHHTPGRQVWIKLRGASFGMLLSLIGPLLLLPVTLSYRSSFVQLDCVDTIVGDQYNHCQRSGNRKANMTRFVYVICYSVTGLGYTILRDFITWTCTLESLTLNVNDRTRELWTTVSDSNGRNSRRVQVPPFHGLNYLGDSSGLSLWSRQHHRLSKTRAGGLLTLLGLQTVVVRVLLIYAISGVAKAKHLDIELTMAMALWPILFIWPVIYIPVIIWFIVPFRSPLGAQNGWRWAKIARDALENEEGTYGVVEGKARFAVDARAFGDEDLQ
ncbi:hypothetical protein GLAREA_09814 [Glarea lozoyensis ATCC 20868]|uniref:Uncharacterized protein n=1 Tax=Glarea lozoyensis (strain ATCC 20868 / MF5171) TaxID=1116229 RepID=S3DQD7_GLAL2|nr:uncharacterized protein GLAREA_09814 [Glarea lozoyensis ATCC 20868]EPE28693.1 hypothetical protein GLAREA_09814 [Glarea lozoyensis ATCC 20868]